MADYLDLYDYRCRMSAMYRERTQALAAGEDAKIVLQRFRRAKDALFAEHPQSALDEEQQRSFLGLRYFPYDPAYCIPATLEPIEEHISHEMALSPPEKLILTTIGQLHFVLDNEPVVLALYWITLYGGGLFLPFRDITSPRESYGGGRYLFDTIKGSEPLPTSGKSSRSHLTLDFNYAYNPSCAYNDRWVCPLAPKENHVTRAIYAGEKKYH